MYAYRAVALGFAVDAKPDRQRLTAPDGWMESWMEVKTNRNSLSEDSVQRNAGDCPVN
jgi:hypothetical protein